METLVLDATGRAPLEEVARLRERGPVTRVALPGGVEAWAVTDLALLRPMLVDPHISKDARQHWVALLDGDITPQWPLYTWVTGRSMFNAYGTEHRAMRKVAARSFTARRTRAMEPRVTAATTAALEALADAGKGGAEVDLREIFAATIPVEVICDLLGVPDDQRADMRRCADTLINTGASREAQGAAQLELRSMLAALVHDKRARPGEDLISTVAAELPDDEAVSTANRSGM